jgi:tRNA-specific 2-thiouridylase
LLAREGHEVIGLSMQLYDHSGSHGDGEVRFGSCCTIDDLHDARRVAQQLGIPHYIVNFERQFDETVVSNFVREYASGRTPIPCVHCNGDLKFADARRARRGARRTPGGDRPLRSRRGGRAGRQYLLKRGVDPRRISRIFSSR